MLPEEFVQQIKEEVITDNLNTYQDILKSTNTEEVTDNYWKEALIFYKKLEEKDQHILFKIIRQIQVDTVSNIFGVLDGTSWLENQNDDFVLTEEGNSNPINRGLQDLFLESEE